MLLSDAESNIAGCTTPQVTCEPRAVGDLVHAGTNLVPFLLDKSREILPVSPF